MKFTAWLKIQRNIIIWTPGNQWDLRASLIVGFQRIWLYWYKIEFHSLNLTELQIKKDLHERVIAPHKKLRICKNKFEWTNNFLHTKRSLRKNTGDSNSTIKHLYGKKIIFNCSSHDYVLNYYKVNKIFHIYDDLSC